MGILKKQDITGHDVFEFMRGRLDGTHWHEDSIYLTEETLAEAKLIDFFNLTLQNFNYYGPTEVSKNEWEVIKDSIKNSDIELAKQLVDEIDTWACS
jgi:hypothetical protein